MSAATGDSAGYLSMAILRIETWTYSTYMTDTPAEVCLNSDLIADTQSLAKDLNIPWDQLVTLALKDFVRRYGDQKELVEQINDAYAAASQEDETQLIQAMGSTHRHIVDSEW